VPPGRGGQQRIPRPGDAEPGGPPPWSHLKPEQRTFTLDDLRSALTGREPGEIWTGAPAPTRTSAVLVPLYESDDGLRVVLTRRSEGLRTHSGEVSFPGGRQDDGESLWETALREAHEEVGLDPGSVCPIGQLDRLRTVSSGSAIVPFVASLDGPPDLAANPHEVDEILRVSVDELLLDEVWREELWRWPDSDEEGREVTFFELVGDTIWGATAKMLRQLLSLGLGL
jgi:8-oxo-dGTP pyrophosphatase MutT (NUDIX family)